MVLELLHVEHVRTCPWVLILGLLAGCAGARSEEALRADFQTLAAESSSCATDAECTIVSLGVCPLDCYAAVNRVSESRVSTRAMQLEAEYRYSGGRCLPATCSSVRPSCVEQRCAALIDTAQPDAGGP